MTANQKLGMILCSNKVVQKSKLSINYLYKNLDCQETFVALCVEMGLTWTFSRNQDATGKLKSELISINFFFLF